MLKKKSLSLSLIYILTAIILSVIVTAVFIAIGKAADDTVAKQRAELLANADFLTESSFDTPSGDKLDSSIYKNAKVTVINFWAPWCGPCCSEIPDLVNLSHEYADKGLQIVGIVPDYSTPSSTSSQQEYLDDINKKISELSIDYSIGLADEAAYGEINKLSPSIPFTIVVDSNGKPIDDLVVGAYSADEWKTMFDKWLSSVN